LLLPPKESRGAPLRLPAGRKPQSPGPAGISARYQRGDALASGRLGRWADPTRRRLADALAREAHRERAAGGEGGPRYLAGGGASKAPPTGRAKPGHPASRSGAGPARAARPGRPRARPGPLPPAGRLPATNTAGALAAGRGASGPLGQDPATVTPGGPAARPEATAGIEEADGRRPRPTA